MEQTINNNKVIFDNTLREVMEIPQNRLEEYEYAIKKCLELTNSKDENDSLTVALNILNVS